MNKVSMLFTSIINFLRFTEFTIDGFTFTLMDVFLGGLVLSLVGITIGKIYLFVINKR